MANMQEKKTRQPTQNLHIMRVEPHEDDQSVNIVTRSGTSTRGDKTEGKIPMENTWVRKAREKSIRFNM